MNEILPQTPSLIAANAASQAQKQLPQPILSHPMLASQLDVTTTTTSHDYHSLHLTPTNSTTHKPNVAPKLSRLNSATTKLARQVSAPNTPTQPDSPTISGLGKEIILIGHGL